jgi:hypothetical protein
MAGFAHLQVDPFVRFPGMAAVFIAAHHLAELRKLVVHRILHEGGPGAPVDAHDSVALEHVIEQRLPRRRIVEEHADRIVEADRVELPQYLGLEGGRVIAEKGLVGPCLHAHPVQGVVGIGDRRVALHGGAVAEVGGDHQQFSGLLRHGHGFFRQGVANGGLQVVGHSPRKRRRRFRRSRIPGPARSLPAESGQRQQCCCASQPFRAIRKTGKGNYR